MPSQRLMLTAGGVVVATWPLWAGGVLAQRNSTIEGVWRITEIITPPGHPASGGVEVRTAGRQSASIFIFTEGLLQPSLREPPPDSVAAQRAKSHTRAEKLATVRPALAGPFMTRPANAWELRPEGSDTVWWNSDCRTGSESRA